MKILATIKAALKKAGIPEKYAAKVQALFDIESEENLDNYIGLFKDNILPDLVSNEQGSQASIDAAIAAYEKKYGLKDDGSPGPFAGRSPGGYVHGGGKPAVGSAVAGAYGAPGDFSVSGGDLFPGDLIPAAEGADVCEGGGSGFCPGIRPVPWDSHPGDLWIFHGTGAGLGHGKDPDGESAGGGPHGCQSGGTSGGSRKSAIKS